MPKQKPTKTSYRFVSALIAALLLVVGASSNMFGVFAATCSSTTDCQNQINNLTQQQANAQANADKFAVQASSYQDAIDKLQSQIDTLQQAIVANQNASDALKAQIAQAQADLAQEKKTLGENIRAMYLEGDVSTLEMLASSKDISQYVNKQTYRNSVQDKVKTTVNQIAALQVKLQQQQQALDGAIKAQQVQRQQLADAQSQQSSMLAYSEEQKAAYDNQVAASQSQINQLKQQIIALNTPSGSASYGGACGGGYPGYLCNARQDSIIDSWGMDNRECVSYTAWKEAATGHYVPYGLGNAGDWIYNVPSSWVSQTPEAGDVAIRPANSSLGWWINGYYEQDVGHAMYVESVNGDGSINISQYNASLNGTYSYVSGRSTAGLYFIHFPSN